MRKKAVFRVGEKQFLGVIPARGGSKGIPRKNLYPLLGRPLISYTFEAAKGSKYLNRIILSTDDEEIAALGRSYAVEVPFIRPARLARDNTPMIEVLTHALGELKSEGFRPNYVVLLQPTSPLRTSLHIDEAIERLLSTGADTVVSVTEVPHQLTPISLMRLESGGRIVPYLEGELVARREDKPKLYARNGPAVLITKKELIESGKLYGKNVYHFEMEKEVSVDIDEKFDITLAELLLTLQRKNRKMG